MKKNGSKKIKSFVTLAILIAILSTTSFAAGWWGQPHYEWAISKGLTTLSNNSSLNNVVSLENFYSTLIKYLQMKNVTPKTNIIQNVGGVNSYNKALDAIVANVDSYISKTSLTAEEYRNVDSYITHIDRTIDEQKSLLTRENLKNIHLYMNLARYKAATLIDDYSYRNYVLSRLGPTKYSELIRYNIRPYFGSVSRREFLVLMFSLLSDRTLSSDAIITEFHDSGVLVGYEDGSLWLDKEMTYIEMFTFLHRFENYDFNPVAETPTEDTGSGDEVIEVR